MLRRWLPLFLGPYLMSACGGSSSETPFPLEPDLAMLDAAGPPRGSEYVVFTGQSAEPPSEPPPERSRQPLPDPEPEPEPLVPITPPDAGAKDGGASKDAGAAVKDAGVPIKDAGAPKPVPAKDAGAPRDASHD